jgi:hypothetical protein
MWIAGWFCLLVLVVCAPRVGLGWLLAQIGVLCALLAGFALLATRWSAFLATGSLALVAWWMHRVTRGPAR